MSKTESKVMSKTESKVMSKTESVIDRLSSIPGIGNARATQLYKKGVRTKTDLRRPDIYSTLSKETKFNLRYKIKTCLKKSDIQRLQRYLPRSLTLVGSGRRGTEYSRDIDFLTSTSLDTVIDQIKNSKIKILGELNTGEKRRSLIVKTPWDAIVKLDVFHADPANWAFALLHHTGPKEFNIRTRAHAKHHGYKLSQYGLFKGDRRISGLTTERSILKKIGVTYKTPAKRADAS